MQGRKKWEIATAALISAACVFPHHSNEATYDASRRATVEGDVVLFLFRNPHSFVQIEAKDPESGQAVPVSLEWESAKTLGNAGVNANALKPGDHVVATGRLARNPAKRALLLEALTRPSDGWHWSAGKYR